MASEDVAHILIVDDDPAITRTLRRTLTYEGYRVSTAADADMALRLMRQLQPTAVILDIMLPDRSGLDVCRQMRADDGPPVLMLTARDDVKDRVLGLDSGADDYLIKPFATEELLARLRAMLRRQVIVGKPDLLVYADLTLDTGSRQAERAGHLIMLRTTEYELLSLFLRHPNQVLTRDYLMESVWGDDFEGESNVLEVYVRYLRIKLEIDGLPRLIHTVRGAGYVLRAQ